MKTMDDFDLKKYLAEGRLLKEEKMDEKTSNALTKELTKIFRKEFGLEGVPFDYYQDGKKIIINPEGFNPDGTLFDMKDDWKGDIIKAIRKHKKNWQSKPNFGGGITIYIKESSEEINENTFTSNPNIKKLKKGLTVRIKKNKNTSGPGTFTFGSGYKTGKIISIDKNEVTVEINKKPIIVTPVGSNGNMGGDFEIVNESKDLKLKENNTQKINTNVYYVEDYNGFNQEAVPEYEIDDVEAMLSSNTKNRLYIKKGTKGDFKNGLFTTGEDSDTRVKPEYIIENKKSVDLKAVASYYGMDWFKFSSLSDKKRKEYKEMYIKHQEENIDEGLFDSSKKKVINWLDQNATKNTDRDVDYDYELEGGEQVKIANGGVMVDIESGISKRQSFSEFKKYYITESK